MHLLVTLYVVLAILFKRWLNVPYKLRDHKAIISRSLPIYTYIYNQLTYETSVNLSFAVHMVLYIFAQVFFPLKKGR